MAQSDNVLRIFHLVRSTRIIQIIILRSSVFRARMCAGNPKTRHSRTTSACISFLLLFSCFLFFFFLFCFVFHFRSVPHVLAAVYFFSLLHFFDFFIMSLICMCRSRIARANKRRANSKKIKNEKKRKKAKK